ncbi:MAG: hypothetical protein MUE63_06600 [Xanthomonadales bacterium]|nr:hypothetical protein [Xanthomonadales bacterium]
MLFAQRKGGFGIALAMQDDEMGKRGEQGFDGILPAGVGDFDQIDQQVVGDAGGVQRGAEISDIARFGPLTAGEGGSPCWRTIASGLPPASLARRNRRSRSPSRPSSLPAS